MSDRRIIVSIDFGTTYSGVAWADTTRVGFEKVDSSKDALADSHAAQCATCYLKLAWSQLLHE